LRSLSDEQREPLILVGPGGLSYEEAAVIWKALGVTVKSRVARERKTLIDNSDGDDTLADVGKALRGEPHGELWRSLDKAQPGGRRGPKSATSTVRRTEAGWTCGRRLQWLSRFRAACRFALVSIFKGH